MATRKTFTIKCIVTGKDETYEITVIKKRPSGKNGQVLGGRKECKWDIIMFHKNI